METAKKSKVLLVDDESLILDIYIQRFALDGYEVASYTSAQDALLALKQGFAPDVILFDIMMPEMKGSEFLETVKREGLAKNAVMIALTNESKDEEKKHVMDLGADDYCIKSSLSPSEIVAKVEHVLSAKKAA
jgi:DNA-binding response OmpR family regulator